MNLILKIVTFVIGMFTHGDGVVEKAAGSFNGLAMLGAVVGVVAWLLGPGKQFTVTLNSLEMGFVLLVGVVAGEVLRRAYPPRA